LRESLVSRVPFEKCKNKSGRHWKTESFKFRLIKKDKGNRLEFERKRAIKAERDRVRDDENSVKAEKAKQKEEMKARIEENKKRKEVNRLKAEIYTVVTNPNKIKRMKKRDLVKRDILAKLEKKI